MMVCFMPYYKKIECFLKALFLSSLLLFASFDATAATSSSVHIKSAELTVVEENYALTSDVEITFSPAIEEALNKGVPLTFLVEFQLTTPRKYWFDDEIISQSHYVTISYHALSRQYLVHRAGRQQPYASLQQAKEDLSKIKDWSVFDKRTLKKGEAYQAALRMRLDQSKLPKPLQVEAAGSDDWAMVSERFRWTPIFNF